MTNLISERTEFASARYSADHLDRFLDDGTAVLTDVPGDEPEVGDLVVIRRPGTARGRTIPGTPRTYRVERVETREASVVERGAHIVRDVTTAYVRFVPAVRP